MTGTPSQTDHVFTIGELSRRADCKIETVRYYERIDIMPQPARNSGGHRLYDEEALKRLVFVRRCRALGFTLDQVRDLLHFVDRGD
ncbi:MAG: MerR family transcriptional regulator, partial [Alphaproteobacteria bacterium]|nr:MerR family transcriptional regulator [Alphaproteobacteria bacterium]